MNKSKEENSVFSTFKESLDNSLTLATNASELFKLNESINNNKLPQYCLDNYIEVEKNNFGHYIGGSIGKVLTSEGNLISSLVNGIIGALGSGLLDALINFKK